MLFLLYTFKKKLILNAYHMRTLNAHSDVSSGTRGMKFALGLIMPDPEGGGQGLRTPLENHKNIGVLSNIGPDPLKSHKATKPAFNVGPSSARQRNAI